MKRTIFISICLLAFAAAAAGQEKMTFTGTAVIYGSGLNTRTTVRTFTMSVTGVTPQADAQRYLSILDKSGQNALMEAIDSNDLGRFALTGSIGRPLNAVVIDQHEGETRIRAVFQRWLGFGELRRGYRSIDYPFGYVEIRVDPRTGKGDGTFIPAARIRFDDDENTVEVEDFGTFPGRLMGVMMRGRPIG